MSQRADTFVMRLLRDTPDSRLFVEMSSFASDLMEARHALNLAVASLTDQSPLAEATQHLVAAAAVAYCRTALHSKVRGRLTDHIQLPDELSGTHDRIKTYRNATVAHSQSELAVTYAIGVFEHDSLKIRDVMAATVLVPVPDRVIREFLTLVGTAQDLLDDVIETVRHRLQNSLMHIDQAGIDGLSEPEVFDTTTLEFDPRSKRRRYPTNHTIYWESEVAESGRSSQDGSGKP